MKYIKLTTNATPKTRIENLTVWMNNQSTFQKVVNLVVLLCWQESFRKNYSDLSARIVKLWIHGKKPFVVKYLKVCYLMVVAWISDKTYVRAPGDPLVSSDKYGLPSIIPLDMRRSMSIDSRRDRDWHMVQAVLTIFSSYRVLRIPGKVKLSTIVDPFSGVHETVNKIYITKALRSLLGTSNLPKFYPKWRFQHLTTAGPNGSPATLGILIDAFVFLKERKTRKNFLKITYYLENGYVLKWVFYFTAAVSLLTYWAWSPISTKRNWTSGRLAEKEEAAGKVRVFAITDWFTQNALHPLHNCLYKILRRIPTDGTMNQDAAFARLNEAAGLDVPIWSFDLSAATDRLPVALQRDVLSHFIGEDLAKTWIDLLTDRFWDHKGQPLRYAVGQPIGAYSSWAILALTHHVIIQMAYQISHQNNAFFDKYAVLGDDVVIYDERTADRYLSLIRGFGVDINMSKSVISSNGTFEFAKRIGHAGINLSPLGAKAMLIGIYNPDLFSVTLIDSITKIGYDIEEARDRLAMLKDYKYIPRDAIRAYEVGLYGPGGVHEKKVDLITYVNRSRTLSSVQLQVLAKRMTDGLLFYYEAELKKIFDAAWDLTYKPVISHLWPGLLDRTLLGFMILDVLHPASIYWRMYVSRIRKEVKDPLWTVRNLHTYYDALDDHLSLVSAYTALIECGVPILSLEFAPEKNAESRKAAVTLGTVQQRVNYISFAKRSDGSYIHAISPRIWSPRPTLYLKKSLKNYFSPLRVLVKEPVKRGDWWCQS